MRCIKATRNSSFTILKKQQNMKKSKIMNGEFWFIFLWVKDDHFILMRISNPIMFLYSLHYAYTLNQIINKTNKSILFSIKFVLLSILFMILHNIYTIFGGQRLV